MILTTRLKALDKTYKLYTLLHRSALKKSAKFRQTCSHIKLCNSILLFPTCLLFFCKKTKIVQNSPNLNFLNFSDLLYFVRKSSKCPRWWNFLGFRNEYFWNFQKMIFKKSEKFSEISDCALAGESSQKSPIVHLLTSRIEGYKVRRGEPKWLTCCAVGATEWR